MYWHALRYVPISEHGLCFRICLCNYVTSQEREKAPIKIEMNLTRLLYLIYLLVFPVLLKIISFTNQNVTRRLYIQLATDKNVTYLVINHLMVIAMIRMRRNIQCNNYSFFIMFGNAYCFLHYWIMNLDKNSIIIFHVTGKTLKSIIFFDTH